MENMSIITHKKCQIYPLLLEPNRLVLVLHSCRATWNIWSYQLGQNVNIIKFTNQNISVWDLDLSIYLYFCSKISLPYISFNFILKLLEVLKTYHVIRLWLLFALLDKCVSLMLWKLHNIKFRRYMVQKKWLHRKKL